MPVHASRALPGSEAITSDVRALIDGFDPATPLTYGVAFDCLPKVVWARDWRGVEVTVEETGGGGFGGVGKYFFGGGDGGGATGFMGGLGGFSGVWGIACAWVFGGDVGLGSRGWGVAGFGVSGNCGVCSGFGGGGCPSA